MDADESKYLEAGFDAAALKVSSLRNILVKHNVEFPSNAKKPELVAIFGRKIAARASKLRKEAGRARRAKGDGRAIEVVDAGSAAGGSNEAAGGASGGGSKRKLSDVEKDEPRRRKKKSSGKRRVLPAAAAAQAAAQATSESEADEADESRRRRKKKK
ncbi:inner nuclear membrane protein enriched at telomere/subtelomere region, partial [Coemansia erecta]